VFRHRGSCNRSGRANTDEQELDSYISRFSNRLFSTWTSNISTRSRIAVGNSGTHRHNPSLRLLDSLKNQDPAILDRTNGGTINVPERATLPNLPTLLEFRFANIPMQRDIFVLGVDHAELGQPTERKTLEFLHTDKTSWQAASHTALVETTGRYLAQGEISVA